MLEQNNCVHCAPDIDKLVAVPSVNGLYCAWSSLTNSKTSSNFLEHKKQSMQTYDLPNYVFLVPLKIIRSPCGYLCRKRYSICWSIAWPRFLIFSFKQCDAQQHTNESYALRRDGASASSICSSVRSSAERLRSLHLVTDNRASQR